MTRTAEKGIVLSKTPASFEEIEHDLSLVLRAKMISGLHALRALAVILVGKKVVWTAMIRRMQVLEFVPRTQADARQ